MIIIFDLLLLISVSVLLGIKNLYLGVLTLVLGLGIGFQSTRVGALLGETRASPSKSRRIKAVILSLVLGSCLLPFFIQGEMIDQFEKVYALDSLLPVVAVIGLFSSLAMIALVVERRKR